MKVNKKILFNFLRNSMIISCTFALSVFFIVIAVNPVYAQQKHKITIFLSLLIFGTTVLTAYE